MTERRSPRARVAAGIALVAVCSIAANGSRASGASPQDLPSCGAFWNRNQPVSSAQRDVTRCIVDAARKGRAARAVVAYSTTEGDAIVQYVFVLGERRVLIVMDSTRDRYGQQIWQQFRCRKLGARRGYLTWDDCGRTVTGRPRWLEPVDPNDIALPAEGTSGSCTGTSVRRIAKSFQRAFNNGNRDALEAVFAREGFAQYSTSPPGAPENASDRVHLIDYLLERHRRGERLRSLSFVDVGIADGEGNLAFELTRLADDLEPTRYSGKAALTCSEDDPQLFLWSMGPKP